MYDFYLLWYLNQNYCRQKFWTLSWVKKSWDLHIASSRPFMQYLKVKVIRCNVIFRWWRVDDDTSKTNNSKKTHYHINFVNYILWRNTFSVLLMFFVIRVIIAPNDSVYIITTSKDNFLLLFQLKGIVSTSST